MSPVQKILTKIIKHNITHNKPVVSASGLGYGSRLQLPATIYTKKINKKINKYSKTKN